MKKWIRLIKKEDGAELIEAAIVYPVVFLCVGFLFYVGIYILQYMTVMSYTQKVAVLAAREISRPGYIAMVKKPEDTLGTASVEMQIEDYTKSITTASLSLPTSAKGINARAYRFWSPKPIGDAGSSYAKVLQAMVDNNSIMKSEKSAKVEIDSSNYVVAQYVDVTVTQKVVDFGMLEAFGIKTPTIKVTAKAAATDIDEFVRNTDLVVDTLDTLAKKLGIDVSKIKDKISEAKKKLGMDF